MRTIDSAIVARLQAKSLRPFVLLDMDIDGTHYRYTDCDVPLVVGGYTYAPRGMKVDPIKYSLGSVVDSVKLQVDNLDDQFTSAFVDGTPQGSDVTFKLVLVEAWGEVDDETGATWGPSVHGLSVIDGAAFIAVNGVDLSAYAGEDGVSTQYRIVLHDSAGKIASGYIGSADEGETLAGELYTNPGCEQANAHLDYTPSLLTLTTDVGTVHGGSQSLKAVITSIAGSRYIYDSGAFTTSVGALYKISVWVYSDTMPSGVYMQFGLGANPDEVVSGTFATTTGVWTQGVMYVTKTSTQTDGRLFVGFNGGVGQIAYVDDWSVQQVSHAGTTGVHIVSSINGAARNWTSIESGFNYNDSSYTFEVLRAGSDSMIYPSDPVTLFEGTLDSWDLDEQQISITLTSEFVQWAQKTLAKHSASCRWKEFKGTECAYSGAETWCDRTYTRCAALGNQANYGGFRWLPSIVTKEVWWGRQWAGPT